MTSSESLAEVVIHNNTKNVIAVCIQTDRKYINEERNKINDVVSKFEDNNKGPFF